LLALGLSLQGAVETVAASLIAVALGTAAWHGATSRSVAPRRRATAPRSAAARR
jgi:hypothetical protein